MLTTLQCIATIATTLTILPNKSSALKLMLRYIPVTFSIIVWWHWKYTLYRGHHQEIWVNVCTILLMKNFSAMEFVQSIILLASYFILTYYTLLHVLYMYIHSCNKPGIYRQFVPTSTPKNLFLHVTSNSRLT